MPEQEFNVVFSKRLRHYLQKYEMTQVELARKLGVGTTSVYNWCNGLKTPRMDKVDIMCDLFHCKRSDLIEEKNTDFPTALSPKDERDIAKDLDRIMGEIQKGDNSPLYYNGVEIDNASINLLQNAIEFALRETKKENKVKYNPNKNKSR
jgi:transcriptional regulator with XRE-family HTH domain